MVLGEPGSQHLDFRRKHREGVAACSTDTVFTSRWECCGQAAVVVARAKERRRANVFRILKERGIFPLPSLVEPIGHGACKMHTVLSALMLVHLELIINCQSNQQSADKVHAL